MKKLMSIFMLAIMVMPCAAFLSAAAPAVQAANSIVFQHMGLTYILMPSGIMCIGSNGKDTMSLEFTGGTNALKDGKVAKVNATCYAITFPLDGFTVYVRPLANLPLVKMLFEGKGYAAQKLDVAVASSAAIERTEAAKGTGGQAAAAEYVKAGTLRFDWSDAKDHSNNWDRSANVLTFDVSGHFMIDPLLGEVEGSYTVPHLVFANAFSSGGTTYENSGGSAWENGTFSDTFAEYAYQTMDHTIYETSDFGIGTVTTAGAMQAHAQGLQNGIGYAYLTAYFRNSTVDLSFDYDIIRDTTSCTASVSVYDANGTAVWSSGTASSGTISISGISLWKIVLSTYAQGQVGIMSYRHAYATVDNITATDGTADTVYYHAYSATNATYNCTTTNLHGNAYIFIPKGTTITGVSSDYNVTTTQTNTTQLLAYQDTHVYQAYPNTVYGNDTLLISRDWSTDHASIYRSLLQFNLSSIPSNATINDAQLKTYVTSKAGTGQTYLVYEVSDNWNENSTTWNNQPSIGGTITSLPWDSQVVGTYSTWDITAWAQEQLTDANLSVGIKINDESATSNTYVIYSSSEEASNKPLLVINYSYQAPSTTATSYSLISFNSTHNILKAPDLANATATTTQVNWTATNAVYDLDAPAYVSPGAEFPVTVTLKDPYGDPIAGQSVTGTFFVPEQVVTDPSGFIAGARALQGCTVNGYTQAFPTVSANTTAEYYTFEVQVNTTTSQANLEFWVPDCYMGLSVEQLHPNGSWVNVDGNANYSLSVPYTFNDTSTPAADWGSLSFTTPSGTYGTLKRVQLAMNGTALPSATLRARVYYATSAAVGFDGENDGITVPATGLNTITEFNTSLGFKPFSTEAGDRLASLYASTTDGKFYLFQSFTGNGEKVCFRLHLADDTAPFLDSSNKQILFAPNHISASYDGNVSTLILNGVLTNTIYNKPLGESTVNSYFLFFPVVYFNGLFYEHVLYSDAEGTTSILIINASSFSGGANTTVIDFSGANNHGTAYGNVQYKVWGNDPGEEGFRATYYNSTVVSSASAVANSSGIAVISSTAPSTEGSYLLDCNTSGTWAGLYTRAFKVTNIDLTVDSFNERYTNGTAVMISGSAVYSVDSSNFVGYVMFNATAMGIAAGTFSGQLVLPGTIGKHSYVVTANDTKLVNSTSAGSTTIYYIISDYPHLVPAFLANGTFSPTIHSEFDGSSIMYTQTDGTNCYIYSGLTYSLSNFTWEVDDAVYGSEPFAVTTTTNETLAITDVDTATRTITFNVSGATTVKMWLGNCGQPEQVKVGGVVTLFTYDSNTKTLSFDTIAAAEVLVTLRGSWEEGGGGGGGIIWVPGGTNTQTPSQPILPSPSVGASSEAVKLGLLVIVLAGVASLIVKESDKRSRISYKFNKAFKPRKIEKKEWKQLRRKKWWN